MIPMNDRTKIITLLIVLYSFDALCLIAVLFNYSWQMMYLMNWLALLGGIIYSIFQFRWIDSK
jgi:hypothetical protein